MQRFFASIRGDEAFFSSAESHHLLDVLRANKGDLIEVADAGEVYLATIDSIAPLRVLLVKKIAETSELPAKLFLGFSLLKGGHDELVLLKGTELGVAGFYPFIGERTIVQLGQPERKKRLERFKKIVAEGASQSKREVVPFVEEILSFREVLKTASPVKIIAYENEKEAIGRLDEAFKKVPSGGSLLALVGPEGGFSDTEVEAAKEGGFTTVGLGKRILRAETASLYLASAFAYAKEGR
jgi:16S rRNA (uracil1498-N3)-methyltransferase